jgi:predicted ATPase
MVSRPLPPQAVQPPFELKEKYSNKYLPASLLSDGTINIIALIIALYFDTTRYKRNSKPLAIIEEPERNIHPYLISKVVNTMKDASQQKQIIITTHSPEILRNTYMYMGDKNILMISRNDKGFSNISRPLQNDDIKQFLNNEMGLDEIYIQNLLEMVA